jgi:hypothetical protein
MDKKLARRNMRTGISMFLMLIVLLGVTFVWAAVYLNAVK